MTAETVLEVLNSNLLLNRVEPGACRDLEEDRGRVKGNLQAGWPARRRSPFPPRRAAADHPQHRSCHHLRTLRTKGCSITPPIIRSELCTLAGTLRTTNNATRDAGTRNQGAVEGANPTQVGE